MTAHPAMVSLTENFTQPVDHSGWIPAKRPRIGRKQLIRLFSEWGFKTGAEIGVWRGEFAAALCAGIAGLRLIGVDPWLALESYKDSKNEPPIQARFDNAYLAAQQNLAQYDAELWRMTSEEAAQRVAVGSLDFVYIDGNHSKASVLQDLALWSPKVRSGGVISGHDYVVDRRKTFIQVVEAVNEYVREHQIGPWFILGDETPSFLWVKR